MESIVVNRAWEIAEPLVAREGMELVDIDYRREGRGTVLRFFLDREGGVTLDDLAPLSRRLGDVLDVNDVVPGRYTLEMSSPGINRRLRKPEHFRRYIDQRVRVRLREHIEGHRGLFGTLRAVEDSAIAIESDGILHHVPFTAIAQANYEHEFPSPRRPNKKNRAR